MARAVSSGSETEIILIKYLKSNGLLERNMLFTEFKLEDAQQVWLEEGIENGRMEVRLEIATEMLADGVSLEKIARNVRWPLETLKEKLCIQ